MKRPSFQFYPADWQANSNLRRCSFEEKGIWLEVMCLLHDQEVYGICNWSLKDIAQAVGCTAAKLKGLVCKGVIKGADIGSVSPEFIYIPRSGRKLGTPVTLIPEQSGPIWYSSRMVEDEYKRMLRGELGGTPKVSPDISPKPPLGDVLDAENFSLDPSPSSYAQASRAAVSSSSSSSSPKEKTKPSPSSPPFDPTPELKLHGVSDQTAKDWLELRKAKKAKVSATALKSIVNEAGKAGLPLERALEISCRRGWVGFEASWLKPEDMNGAAPGRKDWE